MQPELTVIPCACSQRRLVPRTVQKGRRPDARSGKEGTRRGARKVSLPFLLFPFERTDLRANEDDPSYATLYSTLTAQEPLSFLCPLLDLRCAVSPVFRADHPNSHSCATAERKPSKTGCASASLGLQFRREDGQLTSCPPGARQQEPRETSRRGYCFRIQVDFSRRRGVGPFQAEAHHRQRRCRPTSDRVREGGQKAGSAALERRRLVAPLPHEMKRRMVSLARGSVR